MIPNFEDDTVKTIYKEAADRLRHNDQLLFQRFNYSLIATSFLVAAFATLAINSTQKTLEFTLQGNPLLWTRAPIYNYVVIYLAYLVGITGFCFSWLFSAMNLNNALIIKRLHEYLLNFERSSFSQRQLLPPYQYLASEFKTRDFAHLGPKTIFRDVFVYTFDVFIMHDREHGVERAPAPHTWIFPLLFALFWLLAISFYSYWLWGLFPIYIIGSIIYFYLVLIFLFTILKIYKVRKRYVIHLKHFRADKKEYFKFIYDRQNS
jgi:hypothetical protein